MNVNASQISNLLTNPKFWGAVVALLATLGVSAVKSVDPNVLVGAIITIMTVFVGGSAYENGKKAEAGANVAAAQTVAQAQIQAAQAPMMAQAAAPWNPTKPYQRIGE